MVMPANVKENLDAKLGRWRRALADAATGPLLIASEVVSLASHWETVKEEAGGLDCTAFLRHHLGPGRGLAYFAARHDAVKALGEASRRTMHHEVAVWISRTVPEQYMQQVKLALMRGAREQNGNPLTLQQAKPRVYEITGKPARKPKACGRCAELEKLLRNNGVIIPD
jgi:hypothetical protein